MIKSRICDLLGIEYPVLQGGMAWIADGNLAGGGFGGRRRALLPRETATANMYGGG